MTTIAYKNGIIAYDSLQTCGDTITDNNADKCVKKNEVLFFIGGTLNHRKEFIKIYFTEEKKCSQYLNSLAYIVKNNKLYESFIDEDFTIWEHELGLNKHWSFGSGSDHALTAMDLGLSAKNAVKMAARRDLCTGGKIKTYHIFENKFNIKTTKKVKSTNTSCSKEKCIHSFSGLEKYYCPVCLHNYNKKNNIK